MASAAIGLVWPGFVGNLVGFPQCWSWAGSRIDFAAVRTRASSNGCWSPTWAPRQTLNGPIPVCLSSRVFSQHAGIWNPPQATTMRWQRLADAGSKAPLRDSFVTVATVPRQRSNKLLGRVAPSGSGCNTATSYCKATSFQCGEVPASAATRRRQGFSFLGSKQLLGAGYVGGQGIGSRSRSWGSPLAATHLLGQAPAWKSKLIILHIKVDFRHLYLFFFKKC